MQYRNTRAIAIGGVLAAAVIAIALVMPAARLLGTDDGLWRGLALFALPLVALLAATQIPFYGTARGISVAAVLTLIVSLITWGLAIVAVATALSGSPAGLALTIAVFAVPPLILIAGGLGAMRMLNGATPTEDREPAPPLTPTHSRLPHR